MANAMLAVTFFRNKFGGIRLEFNGYQYMINSRRKYRRYWRCVIPDCAARLNTHHEFITKFVYHHNHELDAVDVRVGTMMENIYEEERCPIR